MKKLLFAALALVICLTSCVKDEQYPGISITGLGYTPTAVTDYSDVTVKATISSFYAFTATLYYTANDEVKTVVMTPTDEKGVFSAVIPAMPNDTKVVFYVKAVNEKTEALSAEMDYTVGAVAVDYSVLRLNELNGNDKFIELYNSGAEAINLAGCYIEKDETQNWLADASVTIEAGGFLLLYSEDVQMDYPDYPETLIFHSGLSAKKNVRIQLFTPAGNSIDDFNLVDIQMTADRKSVV